MVKYRYLVILLLLFISIKGYSQHDQKLPESFNPYFIHNHIEVVFIPHLDQKANIQRTSGTFHFWSSPKVGYEGAVNIVNNFSDHWGLLFGLHAGVIAYSMEYRLAYKHFGDTTGDFEIDDGPIATERDLIYLSLPLMLMYRQQIKKHDYLAFSAGGNLRFSPQNHGLYEANYGSYSYFDLPLDGSNHGRPWMNLNFGIGDYHILKWGDMLKLNILFNLSLRYFARGHYHFIFPDEPATTGTYTVNGSYVGLEIGYVFTKARKVMRAVKKE